DLRMFAQSPQYVEAVHGAHDHIANDRGGMVLERELYAFIAIERGIDGIALLGKIERRDLHQRLVVFDDQQRLAHYFFCPRCSSFRSILRRRSISVRSFATSPLRRST